MEKSSYYYIEHNFISNYGDSRETCFCVYCGKDSDTRDHVPSRVLLNSPYPNNLPVVGACQSCNNSFSFDEEYLACFLASVTAGGVENVGNEKIAKILRHKPNLKERIDGSTRIDLFGDTIFTAETERIDNVALKLARGHVAYELNLAALSPPIILSTFPLSDLSEKELDRFETSANLTLFPEIGSRAFQRVCSFGAMQSHWISIQDGVYRYLADPGPPITIRIVLHEYMGIVVSWAEEY